MITIFTPTYNRGHLLRRVFESLCLQTYHDFEWIIVDDGSADDTALVVEELQKESKTFPILYERKENGGKHTAINRGVQMASGELFFILDSDDSLPEGSLSDVVAAYQQCSYRADCAGVCGLMAHHDGRQIGSGFTDTLYESALVLRYHLNVTGDLMEVFKTSVLREHLFPEIEGEKFCPEALVWNRIAEKNKLFCINRVLCYRDYLEGGLTEKIVHIRMKSPVASMMTYQEMTTYDIPVIQKAKSAINYWRFRMCKRGNGNFPRLIWYWNVMRPIGWIMHLKDFWVTNGTLV